MRIAQTFILVLSLAASADGADFYASTSGSGSTCSLASPCSLRTALANQAVMGPGDTLYIRAGTYTGRYVSTLDGGTVRPYPGETVKIDGHATTTLSGAINSAVTTITVASTANMYGSMVVTIDNEDMQVSTVVSSNTITVNRGWSGTTPATHADGATVIHKDSFIFKITGSDTIYRDLEVYSSNTLRDYRDSWAARASGVGITIIGGNGNSIINCLVHDANGGIFTGSSSSNSLIYGNVLYNNGAINAAGDPDGHGLYIENVSGFSRIYRNVVVNSYNFSGQFGGDGSAYVGGDHRYNILANSGAPAGRITVNYLGRAEFNALSVTNNHFFQRHANSGGSVSLFGYGEAITTLTVNDNYFVGGIDAMSLQNVDAISGTGNNFFNKGTEFLSSLIHYYPALGLPTGTFNNNTYHLAQGTTFVKEGVGPVTLAQWKTDSGFDASSTDTTVNMPDTVAVIPNEYEAGRANIVIYATSNPATVNVNLSTTGLVNGQTYTIRNVFDYLGAAVTTGTYNAASPTISISMTGAITNVATPTGGAITPSTTAPDFATLVVLPTSAGAGSKLKIRSGKVRGVRL